MTKEHEDALGWAAYVLWFMFLACIGAGLIGLFLIICRFFLNELTGVG